MDFSIELSGVKNDLKTHKKRKGGIQDFDNTILFYCSGCAILLFLQKNSCSSGRPMFLSRLCLVTERVCSCPQLRATSELYGAAGMLKRP